MGSISKPVVVAVEEPNGGSKPEDVDLYYSRCGDVHREGITHDEMVKAYDDWSKKYDEEITNGGYHGPEIVANAMAQYYPVADRKGLKILDVAAGTGKVGVELVKYGFREMDALEPSHEMLKILHERKLYQKSFESAIGFEPVNEIATDEYDSLVISGGMGEGHIPVSAVDEMIRIVKPGGTVFIVMREEYLSKVQQYAGRLEPYMDDLERDGMWEQMSRTVVPNYSFGKNGVVFCYRVLA